ncbi:MAG: hypothetical protein U9Q79_00555 [Candidatus Hydrogenedentes bacterium]|nr:hypothetical protein [Candidatus Hydrogenedentota bacterium]
MSRQMYWETAPSSFMTVRRFVSSAAKRYKYIALSGEYPGDPGFVAASTDGTTALVCAGSTGRLWLLDSSNREEPGESFGILENAYAGEFLGGDIVLVDRAELAEGEEGGTFFVSELGILDLSVLSTGNTTGLYTKVVQKSEEGSASAGLAVYENRVYAADGLTGEIRSFAMNDLLAAWNSNVPLTWEDGERVGTFHSGGPQGVSGQGTLLIGGIDVETGESSVQFVDTEGALGGEVSIPQNGLLPVYGALYNPVTSKVLVTATTFNTGPTLVKAYISDTPYEEFVPPRRTFWDIIIDISAVSEGFFSLFCRSSCWFGVGDRQARASARDDGVSTDM